MIRENLRIVAECILWAVQAKFAPKRRRLPRLTDAEVRSFAKRLGLD